MSEIETRVDEDIAGGGPGVGLGVAALARGDVVGRYVILDRVGAGAMGVVLAAYDPELDRRIALKLLAPDVRLRSTEGTAHRRLLREAQAMAQLSHPNVVTVHDVGTFEDQVFIAMEFVEGRTLRAWMRERKPWREVVDVMTKAGRGLAAAHAVGLVHRDFKPENVMIGRDRRVRVMDFGLARATDQPTPPSVIEREREAGDHDSLEELTRTGALVGTPAYMAPEQHNGEPADAFSDQFSFAVALYEAVYGSRPFKGDTLGALVFEVTNGNVLPPPPGVTAPTWLRQLIDRGLELDARKRYLTMEALLAELERDRSPIVRRWLALGAIAAVGVTGLIAQLAVSEATPLCRGGEAKLAGIWDDDRSAATGQAMLAAPVPFAQAAWDGVETGLDAYAQAWVAMYTETCEATQVRGEQSAELLDLRMACLDRRTRELDALVAVLSQADRAAMERSVQAVAALTPVTVCADIESLTAVTPLPEDPTRRAQVEAAREELAAAKALRDTGRYREALEASGRALALAQRADYAPTLAEVLFLDGYLQGRLGDTKAWEARLHEAADEAAAGHDDRVAAKAWIELVYVVGYRQARHDVGRLWARVAHERVIRAGDPDELHARLLSNTGSLAYSEGDYARAEQHYRRALALRERVHGEDDGELAATLNNIGIALQSQGRFDEALGFNERSLELKERTLGPDHPGVASSLISIGNFHSQMRHYDQAREHLSRAIEIIENVHGEQHRDMATALSNLAIVKLNDGDAAGAEVDHRRALAIRERVLGVRHPHVAGSLASLANTLFDLGREREALRYHVRGLALNEITQGRLHPAVANTLHDLAHTLEVLGDLEQAFVRYSEALEIREQILPPDHELIAVSTHALGEAHLQLGRPAQALPLFERALEIREKSPPADAIRMAHALFSVARALGELRRDHERASDLAERARAIYAEGGPRAAANLADAEAFLARR